MKTIFILLLGFGGAFPISCSKKQPKQKQEGNLQHQNNTPIPKNNCAKNITPLSNNITIESYS